METWQGDIVVVGAGPAGAHFAARVAEKGARVALLDQRPRGLSGAQWINGVAAWMFHEADLDSPAPPELLGKDHSFTLLNADGSQRLTAPENPILEVDMRRLGDRLSQKAADAGADLFWETHAHDLETRPGGRPGALLAHRGQDKRPIRFLARLFVDASGMTAAIRRRVPELDWSCPPPRPRDLCAAAQEVRKIKDPGGARAFLARHRAEPEQTLAWSGVHGGFSILNVRISEDFNTVSILTGAIATPEHPSGKKMIQKFLKAHQWVGERCYGGSRAIPLRRPYTRLVAPGVALLGDAACQVYSSHGSGIGIGLIAARILADVVGDTVARGEDPGDPKHLWHYAARFHRRWGGLLGFSDVFRRFSQRLSSQELSALMRSLMTPSMLQSGLAQKPAVVRPNEIPRLVKGALKEPRALLAMLPILLRMPLIEWVARTYPAEDSPHTQVDLYRYEERMKWLVDSVRIA